LNFVSVDLNKFSSDQDIEACAILLTNSGYEIYILSVYKASSGNFSHFLKKRELILNYLYKSNTRLILCGDFNVNYLTGNKMKNYLDTLLATYNLTGTVNFPRTQSNSATAIDNIFTDISNNENSIMLPLFNGLSDHDAQLIILNDIKVGIKNVRSKQIRKKNTINNIQSIADSFNNYFLTIDDNNSKSCSLVNNKTSLDYLQQVFHCHFPSINHQAVTSTEITTIIKSLIKIKITWL
jgi:hypothetical protein